MSTELKKKLIQYNTRSPQRAFFNKPLLSPWFDRSLDRAVARGDIADNMDLLLDRLLTGINSYAEQHSIRTAVVGISGGIDSALTAALFKQAGWDVIGVLMPIKQNPLETFRGLELVNQLQIPYRLHDLSNAVESLLNTFCSDNVDSGIRGHTREQLIRQGNIRARLRMITLYNIASQTGGLVASTDNLSELATGFWTLHGDVGDLAPIQSLTKSWEVPALAEHLGLPSSIIQAAPTDGLGISAGDEAQFGFSYAHLDLVLLDWLSGELEAEQINASSDDLQIIRQVTARVNSTRHKRANPANLPHPISDNWRYQQLAHIDKHTTDI